MRSHRQQTQARMGLASLKRGTPVRRFLHPPETMSWARRTPACQRESTSRSLTPATANSLLSFSIVVFVTTTSDSVGYCSSSTTGFRTLTARSVAWRNRWPVSAFGLRLMRTMTRREATPRGGRKPLVEATY